MTTPDIRRPVPADDYDRTRPAESVIAAERAVVGAAVFSNRNADTLAETLTPADFFDPELAVVFQACCELSGSGAPVDIVAVQHHLTATGQLGLLNRSGPVLIAQLLSECPIPTSDGIAHHAEIVADDAHRRRMHAEAARAAQFTGSDAFTRADTDLILERMQRAALLGRRGECEKLWVRDDIDTTLEAVDRHDESARITTPWSQINEGVTLKVGQLVIVGARPGMGKSILGLNLADHVASDLGEGALIASMEMGREEIECRLIAAKAKVPLHRIEHHEVTDDDWAKIARVMPDIQKAHLAIDDGAELTTARLRARLRYMRTVAPTRLIVVDYLQLMRGAGKYERRDLEIADISRSLKLLAKSEGVCVVALCQLGRGPEQRGDKRPILSDLRESGAIEQDADTVIGLYREDFYDPESKDAGQIELIVLKQRSGPRFTAKAAFQGHYSRIVNNG